MDWRAGQYRYSNLVLLAELHLFEDQLGRVPTSTDLKGHSKISLGVYRDRFGSYPRPLEAAGFEPEFVSAQEKARYLREYEELVYLDGFLYSLLA
ncbi:homing endonuclease associated repeat-containing protein [Haloterrigena salifodinae]|uniref:homing endonuclease associated repeat-containing protein n=1 Tax=Haloterrigena salifodinae TaxID=2675099 RepID=UPI003742AAE9